MFYCLLLVTMACKKKQAATPDDPPLPKTKKDLMMEGRWQITNIHWIATQVGNPDIIQTYATYPDCMKDDIFCFMPSGKLHHYSGDLECVSGQADVDSSGTWDISTDHQLFYFASLDEPPYLILELDESTFKIAIYTEDTTEGQTFIDTTTYTNIN